jgi:hypothetical protein
LAFRKALILFKITALYLAEFILPYAFSQKTAGPFFLATIKP